MSLPIVAVDDSSNLKRNFANYHPTIWGNHFSFDISDFKTTDESSIPHGYDELKEEVRRMLKNDTYDASQKLQLIDLTQHLGIAYHFKTKIEHSLEKIHHHSFDDLNDLHNVALRFRLLRQQGIRVSCDVFEKFKDSEGKFKKSLSDDVVGLLSLYQAAFLSIRGEDILDEAIDFSTINLQLLLPKLSPNLAEEVSHALNRPICKCFPRLEARHFINIYEQDESHDEALLKFAKLDFNMLQQLHQMELNSIMDWWRSMDYKTKLPYTRDIIVECYFWIMGVYFEPQYALARKWLTQIIASLSVVDDTYDNYAALEELELFTEAIQRWDMEAIDTLPEYMKMILGNLMDVCNEIEANTNAEGRSFCIHYAKEAFEQKREHIASAVECYVKEYGISEEKVIEILRKEIVNAWKDANEECLKPTPVPMELL